MCLWVHQLNEIVLAEGARLSVADLHAVRFGRECCTALAESAFSVISYVHNGC